MTFDTSVHMPYSNGSRFLIHFTSKEQSLRNINIYKSRKCKETLKCKWTSFQKNIFSHVFSGLIVYILKDLVFKNIAKFAHIEMKELKDF